MTLGEKILALRTQKEMSQEDLAAGPGGVPAEREQVGRPTSRCPTWTRSYAWPTCFGVTVDQLVREGERPEPPEPPEPRVVYVAEGRRGLTGPQMVGVCLEVLGGALLLLGGGGAGGRRGPSSAPP